MPETDIIPFGAAIASDVLSALGLPGGNTLAAAATGYLAKKRRDAAEILISEIAAGRHGPVNFDEHDIEPLIDIVLRFAKAVEDGAARENLLLLSQIIAGLKKNRAFDTDKFRRWCKIVEQLTRDELLVIGFACRAQKSIAEVEASGQQPKEFNDILRSMIERAGYSDGEVEALLTSVTSTGLLSSASAFGGLAYTPTPWLFELKQLADLEAQAKVDISALDG